VELFKIKGGEKMIERVVKEHGHTPEDAKLWMSRVKYAELCQIDEERTSDSVEILKSVGLVPPEFETERLYDASWTSTTG
tara:strand:+ start:457 stop:696 length:240 start_codon:yes stop_codon:yes gene_type:complete